jgi:hypothetical protein
LSVSPRIAWAVLIKRTFGFDVLRCPKCSRKMTLLATLTEPSPVRRILEHLGVRDDPLTVAPARDPAGEQTALGFEDAA